MKMLNFEGKFGYDVAELVDSFDQVVGTCAISLINNNVTIFYNDQSFSVGQYNTHEEAVEAAENWIKENVKDSFYPIVNKTVRIPFMDATDIRYLLKALVEYVEEVGPRELKGLEDRAKEYIKLLPEYDPFEDDEE